MGLKEYRTKIRRRIKLFQGLTSIAVAFGLCDVFIFGDPETVRMTGGPVAGFQAGIIIGLGMLALIQVIKLSMIVKDDKKLELLYNKENDERLKIIHSKAGMPMLMITSALILVAAIIAGYYNMTAFYTLVITGIVQLSIGAAMKLYCMKTM